MNLVFIKNVGFCLTIFLLKTFKNNKSCAILYDKSWKEGKGK